MMFSKLIAQLGAKMNPQQIAALTPQQQAMFGVKAQAPAQAQPQGVPTMLGAQQAPEPQNNVNQPSAMTAPAGAIPTIINGMLVWPTQMNKPLDQGVK